MQQRRANAKFAKTEEKKMGKPESVTKKKDKAKAPVSKAAISESVFLLFAILCLGLLKPFASLYSAISVIEEVISCSPLT